MGFLSTILENFNKVIPTNTPGSHVSKKSDSEASGCFASLFSPVIDAVKSITKLNDSPSAPSDLTWWPFVDHAFRTVANYVDPFPGHFEPILAKLLDSEREAVLEKYPPSTERAQRIVAGILDTLDVVLEVAGQAKNPITARTKCRNQLGTFAKMQAIKEVLADSDEVSARDLKRAMLREISSQEEFLPLEIRYLEGVRTSRGFALESDRQRLISVILRNIEKRMKAVALFSDWALKIS